MKRNGREPSEARARARRRMVALCARGRSVLIVRRRLDWMAQLNVLLLLLARRTAEIASAFVRFAFALRFDNDRSRKPSELPARSLTRANRAEIKRLCEAFVTHSETKRAERGRQQRNSFLASFLWKVCAFRW